jgi:hypothetical protein
MAARTCPECGVGLEPDEQFCGSCGCYLDWSDQPDAVEVQQPAPTAPRAAVPPPPPPRSTAPPPSPLPPPPPPRRTEHPAPQQPRAQQPGHAPPRPRRTPTAPPEPLEHGDLVCGTCGTGNKPTRKFCRRCGDPLAEAQVATVPWWRRVLRRRPKVTEAGARPRGAAPGRARRGFPSRPVVVLVLLGALGIGAYTVRSTLLGAGESVRDRVEDSERVVPDEVRASSAQPGHGAALVKDGATNKYWAPAEPGEGRGQFVEATFRDPVRLVHVLLTPGVSADDEEAFLRQGRPAELRITLTREDGPTEVEEVTLEDESGPAEIRLGTSDVVTARFTILRSHAGNAAGSRTAIGELEFFVRR